jgi:putative hydrolase of HD superfamily
MPAELSARMNALYDEMDAQQTPEAKLYKALDKLEALIQHNEADLSTWLPLENDLQMTYGTAECAFDPWIKSLRDMVRDDSRRKIEEGGC